MRQPALTENEILLRELNETELVLADISQVIHCTCIIDPTETLADRVRHLGEILITLARQDPRFQELDSALNIGGISAPEPFTYTELLNRLGIGPEGEV